MDPVLFVPIAKVDVAKREVWGRATQELPDKVGDIFDYETSKPLFEEWSGEFSKATDGASLGNLREMHQKVAAGKLVSLVFNDVDKAVDIGAKVVDEAAWQKCLEGVYTGFSIGGGLVKRWKDPAQQRYTRFTVKPTEISLADNPMLAEARFTVVKVDGVIEERAFAQASAVGGSAAAATDTAPSSATPAPDGGAGAVADAEKIAARSDASPKEGESKYGDVKFADAKNKKYPIDTEPHIRAAWNYINKPKNAGKYSSEDAAKIKAAIVRAWKSKISKDGPPSADDAEKMAAETLSKLTGTRFGKALEKGVSSIGEYANILSSVSWLAIMLQYEAESEGDDSLVPEQLKTWLELGVEILRDMTDEETDEMLTDLGARMGAQSTAGDGKVTSKIADADVAKAGARHSKVDRESIQAIHDHSVSLGADCSSSMDKTATGDVEKVTSLEKTVGELTTERDTLKKRVAELEKEPLQPKGALRAVPGTRVITVEKSEDSRTPGSEPRDPFDGVDPKNPEAVAKAAMIAAQSRGVALRP